MTDSTGGRVTPFNVAIPSVTSTDYDTYSHQPYEAAAYAQMKFEAFNLNFQFRVEI